MRSASLAALTAALPVLVVSAAPSRAGDAEPPGTPAGVAFRTEADDIAELKEGDVGTQLGSFGAIRIPVEIEADSQATIAIYTRSGRLVRILGQALKLKRGRYAAHWDGLDLFGNLVGPGHDLVAKVITNPGVRAYYEFTVGHGNSKQPWGGHMGGEGDLRRAGGWLGDHSTPNAATAFRDCVLLGSFVVEHGSNLIMVNREGEKIWGTGLSGWSGPIELDSDESYVYALLRGGKSIYRIDPFGFDERGRLEKTKIIEPGGDRIVTIAAHDGRVSYVARNHELDVNHFRYPARKALDHAKCTPQVLGGRAPTEFHISPRSAFERTFSGGGHPQAGARMAVKGGSAFVVAAFSREVEFGSVLLTSVADVETAEVYTLKEGQVYNEREHSPLRGFGESAEGDGDDLAGGGEAASALAGMDFSALDENWQLMGSSAARDRINVVTTDRKSVKTTAFYVKCSPAKTVEDLKGWRPRLKLAQMITERTVRVDAPAKVTLPKEGIAEVLGEGTPRRPGWTVRTELRVSETFPVSIVVDYGKPQSFDGILLLNPMNPDIRIDRYVGRARGDPAAAGDDAWKEFARFKGGWHKKLRSLCASKSSNAQIVRLERRATTRALRFRVASGYRTGKYATLLGGKGGESKDNPKRVELDEVALLRLVERPAKPPSHIFATSDGGTGEKLFELRGDGLDIDEMTFDPSGRLFTVIDGKLCLSEITRRGAKHKVLNADEIRDASCIDATTDRIAVGDMERNAVLIFDHSGRLVTKIGDKYAGRRRRGRWGPDHVSRPGGVAIASDGSIWIAETSFAPKRVSRFSSDGRFVAEHLGPPMYGGGGYLDRDLMRFYYRSMEFELDFARGTSRLVVKNDALESAESPALEPSFFVYTGIGKPVYHAGRRYVTGSSSEGTVICILEEGSHVWRPCVVMGPAHNSVFLNRKDVWNRHFARMDLLTRYFIWCDLNDDGSYQLDEVELFDETDWKGGGKRVPTGGAVGPGLMMWAANARIRPHRFTPGGVPVYRFRDWRVFDYDALAPHYTRNYTLSGPTSAKPGYFGFRLVTRDGSLIQEGQPYIVNADGTIKGGPPASKPSDYLPEIEGLVLSQPWRFAGSVVTKSPLGEVAAVNSNNGYWYVWAADLGVIVGTFFDGSKGGWGSDLVAKRGTDVTGNKQSWEGWGSYFMKAVGGPNDGKCYAVAGKGFHGISRIEGLDDFRLETVPVVVSRESHERNGRLRAVFRERYLARRTASGKTTRKTIRVEELSWRTGRFRLDGAFEEWGKLADAENIGPEREKLFFEAARDQAGLYVAFAGESRLGNAGGDWRKVFHTGFSFDVMVRPNGRSRSRDAVRGDRRIVFANHKGEWIAVLYDYVVDATSGGGGAGAVKGVEFRTPLATTRVSRVTRLGPGDCRFKVKEDVLGVSALTLDGVDDDFGELPTLDGPAPAAKKKAQRGGYKGWCAEVFLPWKTLGTEELDGVRCDFGVHSANEKGDAVAESLYWSNAATTSLGDIAVEASINPVAWGYMKP